MNDNSTLHGRLQGTTTQLCMGDCKERQLTLHGILQGTTTQLCMWDCKERQLNSAWETARNDNSTLHGRLQGTTTQLCMGDCKERQLNSAWEMERDCKQRQLNSAWEIAFTYLNYLMRSSPQQGHLFLSMLTSVAHETWLVSLHWVAGCNMLVTLIRNSPWKCSPTFQMSSIFSNWSMLLNQSYHKLV